jgi:hypothetical protein
VEVQARPDVGGSRDLGFVPHRAIAHVGTTITSQQWKVPNATPQIVSGPVKLYRRSVRTMRIPILRSALSHPVSRSFLPPFQCVGHRVRYRSTTPSSSDTPATAALSPRWLSDVKTRIGKCIGFGISTAQVQEASSILQEISRDWRELLAGSEGFLTGKQQRGLYRQEVVWGEMVHSIPPTMPCNG